MANKQPIEAAIKEDTVLIKHLKWATGDMIALVAGLLIYKDRLIIVLEKSSDERKDQVLKFYKENKFIVHDRDNAKILFEELKKHSLRKKCGFQLDKIFGFVTNIDQSLLAKMELDAQEFILSKIAETEGEVYAMEAITDLVASSRRSQLSEVRSKWCDLGTQFSGSTSLGKALLNYMLQARFSKTRLYPIFVWGRLSGARGGAHPEYDTRYPFLYQIAYRLKKHGYTPIFLGDREDNDSIESYHLPIIEAEGHRPFGDERQFWEKSTLMTRIDQFKYIDTLYKTLSRQSSEKLCLHIGFRSGNLEAMALMGHSVFYLECRHSQAYGDYGSGRMEKWNKSENLFYKKIELSTPMSMYSRCGLNQKTEQTEQAKKELLMRSSWTMVHCTSNLHDFNRQLHIGNISPLDEKTLLREINKFYLYSGHTTITGCREV